MLSCRREISVWVTCWAAAIVANTTTISAVSAGRIENIGNPPLEVDALITPRHQPLDPADARQVVVDDSHHQHHQEDKTGEQHLLFDGHAEVAARNAFDRHD